MICSFSPHTGFLQLSIERHGFELLGSICIWIFSTDIQKYMCWTSCIKLVLKWTAYPYTDIEWVICNIKIINVLISYCFITFLLKNYITVQYAFKVPMQSKGSVKRNTMIKLFGLNLIYTFYRRIKRYSFTWLVKLSNNEVTLSERLQKSISLGNQPLCLHFLHA